jgi:hypothetical protein
MHYHTVQRKPFTMSTKSRVLISTLLLFSAIIRCYATENIVRNLATLAKKWNISDSDFSYGGPDFNLTYTISDFILDEMITYGVYDKNCQGGNVLVPEEALGHSMQPDSTTPSDGDAFRSADIIVYIIPENITDSPTVYSETTIAGELVGIVEFCARISLSTTTTPPVEVNFLEILVTLQVNLTNGFTIEDVDVQPQDNLVATANDDYFLEAFQCDDLNAPLSPAELLEFRNQGSIIRVCVQPDATAKEHSVYMKSINSFSFTRNYEGYPSVIQVAVENGLEAGNHLTTLDCGSGTSVCAFETILFAAFFKSPGSVVGSGTGYMQFGTASGTRRNLRARILQSEGDNLLTRFGIDLELLPVDEEYNRSNARTTSFWGAGLVIGLVWFVV